MGQEQGVRNYFKAPEGKYPLHTDRRPFCNFSPSRPIRLTFATIQHQGSPQYYILYNMLDALAFSPFAHTDEAPSRQVLVGHSSAYPTCHSHHPSLETFDLVVGLSSGDVVVGSAKAQLQASSSNNKLLSMLHFNSEGQIDTSRVVDVAWIPGTNASLFAAAHASGFIYVYQTQSAYASPMSGSSPRSTKQAPAAVPRPILTMSQPSQELTSMTVSPDGTKIASTSKAGVLFVHDSSTGQLLGGFKSHYGGLPCCAWSHDSRYIATGGEDDLVCVYGLTERAVVFWGEGHTSWVTRVAFDRWESQAGTSMDAEDLESQGDQETSIGLEQMRYRIASVGQDCQLLLWDFSVEETDYLDQPDAANALSAHHEVPRGVHRRVASSSNSPVHPVDGHFTANVDSALQKAPKASESSCLPPEISPPSKRSEIFFTTPVAAQLVHTHPCSDLIFMKVAAYTACYTGQIRCWARPKKLTEKDQAEPKSS